MMNHVRERMAQVARDGMHDLDGLVAYSAMMATLNWIAGEDENPLAWWDEFRPDQQPDEGP